MQHLCCRPRGSARNASDLPALARHAHGGGGQRHLQQHHHVQQQHHLHPCQQQQHLPRAHGHHRNHRLCSHRRPPRSWSTHPPSTRPFKASSGRRTACSPTATAKAHEFFEADELTSVRRTSEQRLSRRPHLPLPEAPVWPPYARHASRTYFSVGRQQQLSMTGGGAEWDHAQAAFPPLAWPLTIGSLDWVELQVATVLMDFADGYRGARPKRAFFVTNTQDCRSNGAHWISIAISMQWLNPNTGLPVWP